MELRSWAPCATKFFCTQVETKLSSFWTWLCVQECCLVETGETQTQTAGAEVEAQGNMETRCSITMTLTEMKLRPKRKVQQRLWTAASTQLYLSPTHTCTRLYTGGRALLRAAVA